VPEEQEHLTPGKNNPIQNQTDISKQSKEQKPETVPFLLNLIQTSSQTTSGRKQSTKAQTKIPGEITTFVKPDSLRGRFVILLQHRLWL